MPDTLKALLIAMLLVAAPASGDSVTMVQVADLREEARIAREGNLVLVLEFSDDYCSYCRLLEEKFLLPMQRNSDYDAKVLIRSLALNEYATVTDFDGRTVPAAEFARRYDVGLTPTLLFLNSEGVEMSERLVGIWSEDYFGGYIDERIDAARAGL